MNRKENFYFYNNLVCLVKAVENQYTTIDLHNEECVTGKVTNVDAYMNIELENATFYNGKGEEIPFETFFVRARCIRYVHLPINMPIFETIKKSISSETKAKAKQNNPRKTFKEKRAFTKHKETLKDLHNRYRKF